MFRITTFLKGLIRRVKMKEARIALVMTLIAASFSLILQGANTSDLQGKIIFIFGGFILFIATFRFWDSAMKQIKNEELKERESRDNSTKAMSDLMNKIGDLMDEIRKDRAERSNKASKE